MEIRANIALLNPRYDIRKAGRFSYVQSSVTLRLRQGGNNLFFQFLYKYCSVFSQAQTDTQITIQKFQSMSL